MEGLRPAQGPEEAPHVGLKPAVARCLGKQGMKCKNGGNSPRDSGYCVQEESTPKLLNATKADLWQFHPHGFKGTGLPKWPVVDSHPSMASSLSRGSLGGITRSGNLKPTFIPQSCKAPIRRKADRNHQREVPSQQLFDSF